MTNCTICGLPTAGSDLDDEACCLSCFTANLDGAECKPLAWLTRDGWRLARETGRPRDGGAPEAPSAGSLT